MGILVGGRVCRFLDGSGKMVVGRGVEGEGRGGGMGWECEGV